MPIFTITFPAIDPVFIHLGPIEIRWYALGYIFGLVYLVVRRQGPCAWVKT